MFNNAKMLFLALVVAFGSSASAQTPQTSPKAPEASNTQQREPAMTQIRKTVAFIKLRCDKGGKSWDVRGTGFFVGYPDSRAIEGGGFTYLVTNRHVAMCWNEGGQPREVKSVSVLVNLNAEDGGTFVKEFVLSSTGNIPWVLPEDNSIDLAVVPMVVDHATYDIRSVSINSFATKDILAQNHIREGEPLFFTGFFSQFPGTTRVSPIVRQGIIAMIPDDRIPFVNSSERLYLADVHAFAGNSGSPAFINLAGFHDGSIISGQDYRLFGVVNGEVTEDEHFNLELTTTARATGVANSGVSTIVPADDLRTLLDAPILQRIRDETVALYQKSKAAKQ